MNDNLPAEKKSLMAKFSSRYGVEPTKMFDTLKATAFRQKDGAVPTNEQMLSLMVVADQYQLNPFTKEIYAFPDKGGIVPVVGVDGWSRIINSHPEFDGMDFRYSEDMALPRGAANECHTWIECVMYRKDRNRPTVVREYLDEVYREPFKDGMKGPWQTHTKRFLRHKAMIQCSRLAFGFVGIYDQDEAERIIDVSDQTTKQKSPDPVAYSDADFNKSFSKWQAMIETGQKTPQEVIDMASSKAALTEGQRQAILDITPVYEGEAA